MGQAESNMAAEADDYAYVPTIEEGDVASIAPPETDSNAVPAAQQASIKQRLQNLNLSPMKLVPPTAAERKTQADHDLQWPEESIKAARGAAPAVQSSPNKAEAKRSGVSTAAQSNKENQHQSHNSTAGGSESEGEVVLGSHLHFVQICSVSMGV